MKADDTVGVKALKEKNLCNRSRPCYQCGIWNA